MNRLFITMLSVMLLIPAIVSAEKICSGSSTPCAQITDETQCNIQFACYWDSGSCLTDEGIGGLFPCSILKDFYWDNGNIVLDQTYCEM